MRKVLSTMLLLGAVTAGAFPEIPRESGKALGVTKGRAFSEGLVFVNGKFIPPPYQVERWGTGIRINRIPVTGQVVDWTEFLKTQVGVKAEVLTEPAGPQAATPEPVSASTANDEDDISLDDLFDDNPLPKKPKKVKPATPKTTVSYSFEGEFVKNEAVQTLVKKVNAARTEIDRTLRSGGFICFGDRYARIVGDARAASKLLAVLPELQMKSETSDSFRAGARAAHLVYLNEFVCDELYRNRIDYLLLQKHRQKLRQDQEWRTMMEAPKPLF